jgi:hypothetical protein
MKQLIISPPLTQDDLFAIAAARARIHARNTLRLAREHDESIHDYHPAEVYESERTAMAREYMVSPAGPPDCGREWKP